MKFTAPKGKQVRIGRRKVAVFEDGTFETSDKAEIEALGKAKDVKQASGGKPNKPAASE